MFNVADAKSQVVTLENNNLPYYAVNDDFLLSGLKLPKPVKPGNTLEKTN